MRIHLLIGSAVRSTRIRSFIIEELDLVAVVASENSTLKLQGLFGKSAGLKEIIASLMNENTERVELGFTPNNREDFHRERLDVEGATHEVLHGKWFEPRGIRIPQLVRT